MSETERVGRERAELAATDREIGLEAALGSARAEVERLRRVVARLETELAARPAAPPVGLRARLRRGRG